MKPGDGGDDLTEGGRWIMVSGRRWRATDPAIPDPLRQELVNELMDARRAVGSARRTSDPQQERLARDRVQDAKVALGERGEPWWDRPSPEGRRQRLRATVLALSRRRGPERTICPSDAARAVGGDQWRSSMDETREIVRALAAEAEVEILQRGAIVDPSGPWKGPIRVRRATSSATGRVG